MQELVSELESTVQQKGRISTGLQRKWHNLGRVNSVKDANGKVLVENDQVNEVWKKYMEKLLNKNTWDNTMTCEKVEGPVN